MWLGGSEYLGGVLLVFKKITYFVLRKLATSDLPNPATYLPKKEIHHPWPMSQAHLHVYLVNPTV